MTVKTNIYVVSFLIVLVMGISFSVSNNIEDNKFFNANTENYEFSRMDFDERKLEYKRIDKSYLKNSNSTEIFIDNENDFAKYGFSGEGIISSPYLLENRTLNSFFITNITTYFTIRNCFFVNYDIENINLSYSDVSEYVYYPRILLQIYGYNGGQAKIENNTFFSSNFRAVRIGESDGMISFKDNFVFTSLSSSSFFCISSSNIDVSNNLFNVNNTALVFNSVGNSKIINNSIHSHYGQNIGIDIDQLSQELEIKKNELVNNTFRIIGFKESLLTMNIELNYVDFKPLGYFIDKKNIVITGEYGQIVMYYCENIKFIDVSILNSSAGMKISMSSYLKIYNSNFQNIATSAVDISTSQYLHIANNSLSNNHIGLNIGSCDKVKIDHNNFIEMRSYALSLVGNDYNFVIDSNNFLSNNLNGDYQCRVLDEFSLFYNLESATGNYWSDFLGEYPYLVYQDEISGETYSIYDLYPSSTLFEMFKGTFITPWEESTKTTSNQLLPIVLTIMIMYTLEKRRKRITRSNIG